VVPDPSEQAAADDCPVIVLRSPAGVQVGLTDIWRSDDAGLYYLHMDGACLSWLGQSQFADEPPGVSWSQVFTGSLHADFTISGDWSDVPVGHADGLGRGDITLQIEFDDSGPAEQIYLTAIGGSGGFGGSRWVLESSVPPPQEMVGTFGASPDANCAWIETPDGQRYEMGGPGAVLMYLRPTPLSMQDRLGAILYAPGDPIRAYGSVVPLLGTGCVDSYVFASEYSAP
jgi:hypothetical protein